MDGKIDLTDIRILAKNMKSYDSKYDMNYDGKINILDIIYVVRRIG